MSFQIHRENGLLWRTSSLLSAPHLFSTRLGGVSPAPRDSLNLGASFGDDPALTQENYRRLCAVLGADVQNCVGAKQIHETTVRTVTMDDAGKGVFRPRDYFADALICHTPGMVLTVYSADCGNILLHDPDSGAVGAVHAGWRGCAAGILGKAVDAMKDRFGTDPSHLHAALGPCIRPCCFETDEDVPSAMLSALGEEAAPFMPRTGSKWHVDLAGLNRLQLLRCGISAEQIDVCEVCTACNPSEFWSHRKMGSERGVQGAMIFCTEDRL